MHPAILPVSLFLAASILSSALAAQDMLGVTFGGQLVAIDSQSGASTAAGNGLIGHNAMAEGADGLLWSVGSGGISIPGLLTRIDRTSLTVTATHVLPPFTDIRALARGPGATLYAIQQFSSPVSDALVRIDTTTGEVTMIGAAWLFGIQAMAELQGVLYGWDSLNGLVTIDVATGLATDVAPAGGLDGGGDGGDFQWLTTTPDGRLLGGRSQVFEIDPATGVETPIGNDTGVDLRGAEYTSFAYPFGTGCGVGDAVRLSVSGSIEPGGLLTTTSINHRISPALFPNAGVLLIGLSNESTSGVSLPLDLGSLLGATGCELGVSPDITLGGSVVSTALGSLSPVLPIPATVSVDRFFMQHVGLDLQAPGGSVWSNSVGVVIP